MAKGKAFVSFAALALASCDTGFKKHADEAGFDKYLSRDGAKDAVSDYVFGLPLQILYFSEATFKLENRFPGLDNCSTDSGTWRYGADEADVARTFTYVGEASSAEAVRYTPEKIAALRATYHFILKYNETNFRIRRADLLRICPKVALEEPGSRPSVWDEL